MAPLGWRGRKLICCGSIWRHAQPDLGVTSGSRGTTLPRASIHVLHTDRPTGDDQYLASACHAMLPAPAVPWTIEIRRGVSHLSADLRELQVSAFEITGGATESELSLPRPRGTATVRIGGGASRCSVKRPRGTAAQVVVRGGASNLVFDAQQHDTVGSAARLATPGWDSSPDRWSIELIGGASELSVTEL